MKVLVIHGPSLDLLGTREPEMYGTATLAEVNKRIEEEARALGIETRIHQTAREGEFIELLTVSGGEVGAAIVNPAAYSHTSRAIADAIKAVPFPVVEVHLSNIHAREEWRRTSVTGEAAAGVIAGLGPLGYLLALRWIAEASG